MAELEGGIPEPLENDPEIEAGSGQEVPEIPGPRSFVILQDDGSLDFGYTIGTLDLDFTEGDKSCEIAAIAVIDGKLLVAVPETVWSKSVQKRRLGSRALAKPNLVAVASCLEDSREAEEDIVVQLRVWVGFLHPELEKNLEFIGPGDADFPFGEHEGQRAVPFGPALVEVANDHFNFMTAESAVVPESSQPRDSTARLDHLEAMMRDMKSGLDALLGQATGGATLLPPSRKKQVAAVAHGGEDNGGPRREAFRGLDPSTVQNALQAGIPAAHLCEVGKIMKERPKRLEEVPRGRREVRGGPLSESEEDFPPGAEPDVEGPGDGGGSAEVTTVEKALLELTKIAGRLAANKTKKDQLEALLDGVGSGSAAGSEGSSGGGKRNAAALRALTKCLKENPKYIYEVIESNLQADFQSRPVQPGEPLSREQLFVDG